MHEAKAGRRKHDISSRFQLLSSPFPSAFSVFSLIFDLLSFPYYTNDSLSVYLSLSFHSFTPELSLPVSRPSRILTMNTFGYYVLHRKLENLVLCSLQRRISRLLSEFTLRIRPSRIFIMNRLPLEVVGSSS